MFDAQLRSIGHLASATFPISPRALPYLSGFAVDVESSRVLLERKKDCKRHQDIHQNHVGGLRKQRKKERNCQNTALVMMPLGARKKMKELPSA